jgi:polyferredoxin
MQNGLSRGWHATCSTPGRFFMIDGIPSGVFVASVVAVLAVSVAALAWTGSARATGEDYVRWDLLRVGPIRRVLLWRPFRFLMQAGFALLFVFVIVTGLFGRQQAGSNAATVLTWTYWWILLVLFAMVLGKAWCYMCPWDAISGWLTRLSAWGRPRWPLSAGIAWPRALRNLYPAAILFLVLTWLELGYGVTTSPLTTASLALLMFFLTFFPALAFERGSFCRYGCLVGRISGLYALFAPIELRARDRDVCRTCRTRDCYHGNERGNPCPTYQYLGGMTKNTYCIMCGECIFTCPRDNVALNLRPFGSDLAKATPVRADEAAMVIIMLSMSTFHGITMTPVWHAAVRAVEGAFGVPFLLAFTIGMAACLGVLGAGYLLFVRLSHAVARPPEMSVRQLAIRYAYALLPIALFYHFAHNSMHFFIEGATLVPVLSDPFGWNWDLLGTANVIPGPLVPLGVVWALMVGFVLLGQVWALVVARRIATNVFPDRWSALRSQVPMLVCMVVYSALSLWIIAQPMEMRTGL